MNVSELNFGHTSLRGFDILCFFIVKKKNLSNIYNMSLVNQDGIRLFSCKL